VYSLFCTCARVEIPLFNVRDSLTGVFVILTPLKWKKQIRHVVEDLIPDLPLAKFCPCRGLNSCPPDLELCAQTKELARPSRLSGSQQASRKCTTVTFFFSSTLFVSTADLLNFQGFGTRSLVRTSERNSSTRLHGLSSWQSQEKPCRRANTTEAQFIVPD
jgi:hypothetical protein